MARGVKCRWRLRFKETCARARACKWTDTQSWRLQRGSTTSACSSASSIAAAGGTCHRAKFQAAITKCYSATICSGTTNITRSISQIQYGRAKNCARKSSQYSARLLVGVGVGGSGRETLSEEKWGKTEDNMRGLSFAIKCVVHLQRSLHAPEGGMRREENETGLPRQRGT